MADKPYTLYTVQRRRRWRRIVLYVLTGLVLLAAMVVGGSYLWFREQVVASNKRVDPEVKVVITEKPSTTVVSVPATVVSPDAMNLLMLGSDSRDTDEEEYGRSDTIILVHIDPGQDYLSVLSLPRDLRVPVRGHGLQKINAAFSLGGPALTIQTVEDLTGVDINHYMEIDFNAFRDVTDALGGVYVDVDRRYYNDNPEWELIKLSPGYQLLHGDNALDYVRYRHDQNMDFGRMARQQRFLAAVREQAMGWNLPFKLPRLVSALFQNINTDLGTNDILELAHWGVRLDGANIRQISLIGATDTIGGASYVLLDEDALKEAVTALLTPPNISLGASSEPSTATTTPHQSSTTTTVIDNLDGYVIDVLNANGRSGEAGSTAEWLRGLGARVETVGNAGRATQAATTVEYPSGMAEEAKLLAGVLKAETANNSVLERLTVILGEDFSVPSGRPGQPAVDSIPGAGGWKTIAKETPFAVQAPAYLPEGYSFVEKMPVEGATYDIEVDGGTEPAFKMLYRYWDDGDRTDQYMGITETTWTDAPAASEGVEVEHNDTTFTIVGSNGKVERVWWKSDGVLYWVSNTLSYLLSKDEMLAVAQSMILIPAE